MARDDNDNDDGDEERAQRPWKKRREKGLRALCCPTMKGFASLQRALLHARDEARRRRSGRRGGFGGKEKGEKGKGGRRDAYREERKKGRKKGERDREIKEVDDNAAVVRPLAQGAQGGHYIVLLFRAYAAISAGDRDRVCVRAHAPTTTERRTKSQGIRGSDERALFVTRAKAPRLHFCSTRVKALLSPFPDCSSVCLTFAN